MKHAAIAAFLATTLAASTASAWCAVTTCKPEKENCNVDENGCSRVGARVRWPSLPIEYRFSAWQPGQLQREEARAAVRAAFNRWSDVLCGERRTSLRFVEREETGDDKPLEAGARGSAPFGIYFRNLGWPYLGREDATLAQTNHVYGKKTGVIQYADIEINAGSRRFSTSEDAGGTDLQAVITHEVGHYIGLAHSRDPVSIMTSSYCDSPEARCDKGKVVARRLSADDVAAVCALYPPEGVEPAETEEEAAGCSASPSLGGREGARLATVLATVFAAVAAARRRRAHRA